MGLSRAGTAFSQRRPRRLVALCVWWGQKAGGGGRCGEKEVPGLAVSDVWKWRHVHADVIRTYMCEGRQAVM